MKIVGKLRPVASPTEALQRAERIITEANLLAPHPRPRGFVFKARTWSDYEAWRKSQPNPRLW